MTWSIQGYSLVLLLTGAACSCGTPEAERSGDGPGGVLALVGGKVYPSSDAEPIEDGVVVIRDGRIAAVGRSTALAVPGGAQTLDCRGLVVLPAFWNSHVHFTETHWNGADTASPRSLDLHLQEMLTRYGFARVLDTGSDFRNTLALRQRIESGEVRGPDILTTGPGFVPPHGSPFYIRPAQLPEIRSPADAREQVAARLKEGADAIKLFTGSMASPTRIVPMPVAIVTAATREAHRQGRLVVAHPSNSTGVEAALDGGVDILAHTSPDGGPWSRGLRQRMRAKGISLIPTLQLWKFELSRKGADSATIRRFLDVALEQLRAYTRAGGEILFGTDVGYMTDYNPADEYRFMQRAGLSWREILAALTKAPARRFGDKRLRPGSLELGTDADVVVIEGDPEQDIAALARVRYTLRAGRMLYSAGEVATLH